MFEGLNRRKIFIFMFIFTFMLFLCNIKLLSSSLREISFYHVRRQGNCVAYKLARRAICNPLLIWMEVVPPNIFDVYNHDLHLIDE